MIQDKKYGDVPESILILLKRYRVSKTSFEMLLDKYGRVITPWSDVEKFIRANIDGRYYRAPKYL